MAPGLLERQYMRARNGLAYVTGETRPQVAQTPRDLIWKRDKARLWRYRSNRPRYGPPVLIVHSLVSKSYVLDLLPNTSMVRFLVDEGFDTFLLDWQAPDPADGENTFETYVDGYIPEAIRALGRESGADEVTVIGYCFGGVLTLLLAAAHPGLPIRNMMVMATPCDFREIGFMANMFRSKRLHPDDVIDPTGLVPASVLDAGFQSLKPTDRVVQRVNFLENLWNDEFVQSFLAMGNWARDQVPFPGELFRQTVDVLICENALLEGVIPYGRSEVRLDDVRCPFLNAFAEKDTITPARSSEPLTDLVGSDDAAELRLQSGHVGFVAGRQAAKVARPQIADWLRNHSDEL
jgi:poly[(R)-3-hydroxyalkanoate] polymerase subunit PhaC